MMDKAQNIHQPYKADFSVSDDFLGKAGLPRIDRAFLDDFEKRQPWKTFRYRFFYFFRRWPMIILVGTTIFPSIALMDRTYNSGELFYTWIGLCVVVAAIVADFIFVPQAPDQKLTVSEIYGYFYDKNFEDFEKQLEEDLSQFKKSFIKHFLGFPLLIFFFAVVGFNIGVSPIVVNFIVFGLTICTATRFFYKFPYDFYLEFYHPTNFRYEISKFLKNNRIFGGYGITYFSIPYLIGSILYLLHVVGTIFFANLINLRRFKYPNEAQNLDAIDYVLIPFLSYPAFLMPILYLFVATTMVTGMRYVSFAKEISQRKIEKE